MARRNDDNDLSGIIYKNPDHKGSRPDMKGMVTIDGRLYWISGWTKETRRDTKLYKQGIDEFVSLALEPADDEQDRGRGRGGRDDDRNARDRDDRGRRGEDDRGGNRGGGESRGSGFDDMNDDIPFVTASLDADPMFGDRKARRLRMTR